MIHDLLQQLPDPAFRADILIVGAGAAGIVLAVELARLGRQVTLLEGGGASLEEASQEPYRSEISGLPHRGIHAGRFRVQGGTTTMWGGQIVELDPIDFETRNWVRGSGWPISKSALAPHYARARELEGVSGAIVEDRAVWQTLGSPMPDFAVQNASRSCAQNQLVSYLSRWCPDPNFAHLHRRTLERSHSVDLWLHSNAVELLMKDAQVTGVRCRTLTGIEAIFHAGQYVFCLGAIESSRFFLQPRAGRLPWNESGLLGCHFQDHIDSDAATLRPVAKATLHRQSDTIFLRGYKYSPKLKLSPEAQCIGETLNAGGTIYSVSDADATIAAIKSIAGAVRHGRFGELTGAQFGSVLRELPLLARHSYRYAVEHRAYHSPSAEIKLRVHCEQQPDSSSSISLSDERDALGMFRSRLNWHVSPLEIRTIRRFVEVARCALAGVAEVIPHPDLLAGDDRFVEHCEDSFHHMSGMRMHPSPNHGIVDTDLRLHGTRNAFVCSSAVFPSSGFSNPTHTLLALAVRLASHLHRVA